MLDTSSKMVSKMHQWSVAQDFKFCEEACCTLSHVLDKPGATMFVDGIAVGADDSAWTSGVTKESWTQQRERDETEESHHTGIPSADESKTVLTFAVHAKKHRTSGAFVMQNAWTPKVKIVRDTLGQLEMKTLMRRIEQGDVHLKIRCDKQKNHPGENFLFFREPLVFKLESGGQRSTVHGVVPYMHFTADEQLKINDAVEERIKPEDATLHFVIVDDDGPWADLQYVPDTEELTPHVNPLRPSLPSELKVPFEYVEREFTLNERKKARDNARSTEQQTAKRQKSASPPVASE